jgi:hypothetical protein
VPFQQKLGINFILRAIHPTFFQPGFLFHNLSSFSFGDLPVGPYYGNKVKNPGPQDPALIRTLKSLVLSRS